MDNVDDILAHFGKKGMKWGVRKESTTRSVRKARSPQELSVDAAVYKSLKVKAHTKGLSSLSNDEVRVLTSRFDLEQRYSKMNSEHAGRGKKFAKKTLKRLGTHHVDKIIGAASAVVVGQAIAKATAGMAEGTAKSVLTKVAG